MVKLTKTLLIAGVMFSTVSLVATGSAVAGDDYCRQCDCEKESCMKRLFGHCCCCNCPEPPRGFMAFSVPAIPTTQIAAPIQFQQPSNQSGQDQKQAARFSLDDQMSLMKDLKAMRDLLNEIEAPASAQAEEKKSVPVEQRLDDLERDIKELTKAIDDLARVTEQIRKKSN